MPLIDNVCKVCGRQFSAAKGLRIHATWCFKSFRCKECNLKLDGRTKLNAHMAELHHPEVRSLPFASYTDDTPVNVGMMKDFSVWLLAELDNRFVRKLDDRYVKKRRVQ